MAVDIQRERSGGMTQVALHGLDIIAGAEGCHGVRVTQIMETGIGTPDGGNVLFELTVDDRLGQVLTDLIGEDQITVILPAGTGFLMLLLLGAALS